METAAALNCQLSGSCQEAKAACCKKGKVFLPMSEYARILAWLEKNSPAEINSFQKRCAHHDGQFVLYDQENWCQFLTEDHLCRLHADKVKPSECFWWPLHVYAAPADGSLEIRVATQCCGASQQPGLPEYVATVEKEAGAIGHDVIRAFRRVFDGGYANKTFIKKI